MRARRQRQHSERGNRRGFTLLELLVATAVFSILAASLYGLFRNALSMRERVYKEVEDVLPRSYITAILRRDLNGLLPPNGDELFRGYLYIDSQDVGGGQMDEMEFYSTSGVVTDAEPYGDARRIDYYLEETTGLDQGEGMDFVRSMSPLPDLLVNEVVEPEIEHLLTGVSSLEFTWFDGTDWQDSLDTTVDTDIVPEAVKMRIEFAKPEQEGEEQQPPIEMVCATMIRNMPSSESGTASEVGAGGTGGADTGGGDTGVGAPGGGTGGGGRQ